MTTNRDEPVLLVEDTRSLSDLYERFLSKAGYSVICAYDAEGALAAYHRTQSRLVLLDLVLPDQDGLAVLRHISAEDPTAKVIVITANGTINRAVEAMRGGAFDFLVKPFDERKLIGAVENARALLRDGNGAGEALATHGADGTLEGFQGFIGRSPAMQRIYSMVRTIARSTATVFVTGESGTGKEVCAQAIHDLSTRARGPFVPVNCGAIPRDLLESELFGHLKGAFTGAYTNKKGAAAVADGGTLFLDEICEMDLALQTKLLRFLQTSMIQPVGAAEASKVDVRIVCATNRDPAAEVRAGRFREDLFYRLYVVPIHLPALRERGTDIVILAESLLQSYAEVEGRRFNALSAQVRQMFLDYAWPGNVRELQNVIRNIVVLHDAEEVTPDMVPREIARPRAAPSAPAPADQPDATTAEPGAAPDLDPGMALDVLVGTTLAELEQRFILKTIAACDGSIPKAARLLGVSPSTLYRKRDSWEKGSGS